jgi:xanthine dehydrogenase accessory factor
VDVYREIEDIKRKNLKAALAIVVDTRGSTPGKVSSKMIIYADGKISGTIGGGKVEKDIIAQARNIIKSGQPRLFNYTLDESYQYMCGGKVSIYVEPLKPALKVIIFGAGHVGQALLKILKLLDYYVVVIDDREEFANKENLIEADEIICDNFLRVIDNLSIDENTFVVVVSRDHEWDLEITKKVLPTPSQYIGVIGSQKKSEHIFKELKSAGFNEKDLARVYSPVGIPIKSETPTEIGISIAAQIIDLSKNFH